MKNINKYSDKKICLIGAGKVGSILYHSLLNLGFNFSFIIDSNASRAKKISRGDNKLIVLKNITGKVLKESDVIIFAVQDKNLKQTIKNKKTLNISLKGKILFHTSGVETSDIFKELTADKRLTGSLHPLQTFNVISYENNNMLNNIYFGTEGGNEALKYFKYICGRLKSKCIMIDKNKKVLYHSACVIASNFLVAHFNILSEITKKLNSKSKFSVEIFEPIVKTTLGNIFNSGIEKSLTGPFARGDVKTIDLHLKYFRDNLPLQLYYYVLLGLETLNLSKSGKNISRKTEKEIEKLLLNNI